MRRVVLSLLLASVCDGGGALTRVSFARSLLEVAGTAGEGLDSDDASTLSELERIASDVREGLRRDPEALPIAVLNQTVFGKWGFVREVDDTDLRFVLLPSVLEKRRGSCVGLGTLYLAVAEMLGWHAEGVMVPGHFFVRVGTPGHTHNVELLRRGEEMPDAWYRTRFPIPGEGAPEYARPLAPAEVVGIVQYDIGKERRRQGRLAEARRAYEQAGRNFPDFAEAYASLGATMHLMGALAEAEAEYRAARRANPYLAGVERNLDLLETEKRARGLAR